MRDLVRVVVGILSRVVSTCPRGRTAAQVKCFSGKGSRWKGDEIRVEVHERIIITEGQVCACLRACALACLRGNKGRG